MLQTSFACQLNRLSFIHMQRSPGQWSPWGRRLLGASSARPLQSPPGLFCEVRYLVGRCSTLFAWARSCLRNREDILIPWRLFCQVKYGWPAGAEGPQSPALHAKLVRAPHPECGCDVKNSVAGVLVPPCPSGCRIPHIIPALVHGSKSQVWQRWVDTRTNRGREHQVLSRSGLLQIR